MNKALWVAAVSVCLLAAGCVIECPLVRAIVEAVGG